MIGLFFVHISSWRRSLYCVLKFVTIFITLGSKVALMFFIWKAWVLQITCIVYIKWLLRKFCLTGRVAEREKERKRDTCPLVHSLNDHKCWSCTGLKPGARRFFPGLLCGWKDPCTWTVCYFPRHIRRELDFKLCTPWDSIQHPYGMPVPKERPYLLLHSATPACVCLMHNMWKHFAKNECNHSLDL